MAKQIIAALRRLPQLKGSTFLAAIEIAHRASDLHGACFMSYSYLADKTHQSRRTAFRQVERLVELGVLRVQHFRNSQTQSWEMNRYTFCIPWRQLRVPPTFQGAAVTVAAKFPNPENTSEKFGTLEQAKQAKTRALGWVSNPMAKARGF